MNLNLDGPTYNTIWSFHFERDGSGVLTKTNRCTDICVKLQSLIGKERIDCPWNCGQEFKTNSGLRYHITAQLKNSKHNFNDIKF